MGQGSVMHLVGPSPECHTLKIIIEFNNNNNDEILQTLVFLVDYSIHFWVKKSYGVIKIHFWVSMSYGVIIKICLGLKASPNVRKSVDILMSGDPLVYVLCDAMKTCHWRKTIGSWLMTMGNIIWESDLKLLCASKNCGNSECLHLQYLFY